VSAKLAHDVGEGVAVVVTQVVPHHIVLAGVIELDLIDETARLARDLD
jgi:hypothetical protein